MLTVIGDILNWLTAGLLFPIILLPAAALLGNNNPVYGSVFWLVATIICTFCVLLFGHLAVDLTAPAIGNGHYLYFGTLIGLTMILNLIGGPDQAISLTERPVRAIVRAVGRIPLLFIVAMALVQFGVVILRYVFGVNSIFMQESVMYLHGGVFLLAGGYTLLTDDHVRVDIFYREASLKRKALVDFAGTYLFLFPFCFVLLWAGGDYVANAWAVKEGSTEQSGIQGVYLLKSLIPLFGVMLALAGFLKASEASRTLRERAC